MKKKMPDYVEGIWPKNAAGDTVPPPGLPGQPRKEPPPPSEKDEMALQNRIAREEAIVKYRPSAGHNGPVRRRTLRDGDV